MRIASSLTLAAAAAVAASNPSIPASAQATAVEGAVTECIQPDPFAVMDAATQGGFEVSDFYGEYATTHPAPGSYQWVGTKWWDARNGLLIAMTCSGDPVHWIDIGGINWLEPVRIEGFDAPVVKVEYLAGSGSSGFRSERTALFALVKGEIVELWGAETYFTGFQLCECRDELQAEVDVSPDGLRIDTRGFRRTIFGEWQEARSECTTVAIEQEQLAAQSLCWDGDGYTECGR